METITLNDGTILNGHCIEGGRTLFVYLDNTSMLDGLTLFSDPEKTSIITALNHGHTHTYIGYTQVDAISREYGNCNLVMSKPEEETTNE